MHASRPPFRPVRPSPAPPPRTVHSEEVLRGAREVRILHDGVEYRLRLTSRNKLILTK